MDKDLEATDKLVKDELFGRLDTANVTQTEIVYELKKFLKTLGYGEESIPITARTVRNKIILDLSARFENAGISMFSEKQEKYKCITASFIGMAIIEDLVERMDASNSKLRNLIELVKNLFDDRCKKINDNNEQENEQMISLLEMQDSGPIRRLFLKIKAFFNPFKYPDLSLTEEEQEQIRVLLESYTNVDKSIWNYKLEYNLVPALVKSIAGPRKEGDKHRYNYSVVPGLLEESVIPYMEKLGLGYLIPKLKENLDKEYKDDIDYIEKEKPQESSKSPESQQFTSDNEYR